MRGHACRPGIHAPFPTGPLYCSFAGLRLGDLPLEEVAPVRGARVAIANYDAIRHDFQPLFETGDFAPYRRLACRRCADVGAVCRHSLDAWLVDEAAVVSSAQLRPNSVNSPIDHAGVERRAVRPPGYGRALILAPKSGNDLNPLPLFDIKGCGVGPGSEASHLPHRSGLDYLGIALADFFYASLVDRIFQATVPGYASVPVYAVMDLGFDITGGGYGTCPAGLHVRRAHTRERAGLLPPVSSTDGERVEMQMELILRAFGLTTANSSCQIRVELGETGIEVQHGSVRHTNLTGPRLAKAAELMARLGGRKLEMFNLQMANTPSFDPPTGQIVDFGQMSVRRRFYSPAASLARDGLFGLGRIIEPGDQAYVQPDPRVAIDADFFSRTPVNAMGFYLADAFRGGRLTSRYIELVFARAMRKALARSRGRSSIA